MLTNSESVCLNTRDKETWRGRKEDARNSNSRNVRNKEQVQRKSAYVNRQKKNIADQTMCFVLCRHVNGMSEANDHVVSNKSA